MPKGSKKRKAIKRKNETANHHSSSTNSSSPQGNGIGGDHDSSDQPLTDEDFSPRAAIQTPLNPEPELEPELEPEPVPVPEPDPDPPEPEAVPAVSNEASVVPVEQQNVLEAKQIDSVLPMASEVLGEPSAPFQVEDKSSEENLDRELTVVPKLVSEEAADIHVNQQEVSESEQTEVARVVTSDILDEPSASFQVEEESGEGNLYRQLNVVPESNLVSETLDIHVNQQEASESEQTEVARAVTSDILDEPSAPFQVEAKNDGGSLQHEQAKVPEAISRDAPSMISDHLFVRRASWWNCCGLLDVLGGEWR